MASRAERITNRAEANARDLAEAERRREERRARQADAQEAKEEEKEEVPDDTGAATGGEADPQGIRRVQFRGIASDLQMVLAFKRLGMKKEAAQYMVQEQDIDTIEKFMELDEDQIHELCNVCRKLSKTPPHNGNMGFAIGILAETNFKRASFYCKYLRMTSRTPKHEDINKTNADSIKDFKREIEAKSKPEKEPPVPENNKVFEFFDNFREYLDDYVGTISGRPLTYVVRKDWVVLDSDIDPPFGHVDSSYGTYFQEIENRAPIKTIGEDTSSIQTKMDPHFIHDNVLVWKILYGALRGTTYHPYIKPFLSKQDGRGAFQALHKQLLGTQAINTYAASALNALQNLHLDGTKKAKDWNLDRYIQRHMDQHAILEKLTKFGHQGIGEQQKIHYFLQGITAPNLVNVKASLAVTPQATFQETSTAFKTYATAAPQQSRRTVKPTPFAVASVDAKSGNRSRDKTYKGPSPKSDGYDPSKDYSAHKLKQRYYAKDEWAGLTKGQRNYLRQHRKKGKENKRTLAELTKEVESLKVQAAEVKTKTKAKPKRDDDSDCADSSDTTDDDEYRKRSTKRSKTSVTTKRR